MTVLEEGARSRLHMTEEEGLQREFTDTGARCPVPFRFDNSGRVRISGNRTLDSLIQKASETPFRGESGSSSKDPPLHIQSALRCLLSLSFEGQNDDIQKFSQMCGVKESTAWSYLFQLVEAYPSSNVAASRLLYPPLLPALLQVDQKGSLKQILDRLNDGPFYGDMEWKCVKDRYAHIRLARLCLSERG